MWQLFAPGLQSVRLFLQNPKRHPADFTSKQEDADRANDTVWTRDFFEAVMPYATGRAYVNFLGNEGQERVRAAYGEAKYARLAKVKARWDPDNVFRMNQNVVPSA